MNPTEDRLKAIRQRLEAATLKLSYRTSETRDNFDEMMLTIEFIEHAYNDISFLLSLCERLTQQNDILTKALQHPHIEDELSCECQFFEGENGEDLWHTCIKCCAKEALAEVEKIKY